MGNGMPYLKETTRMTCVDGVDHASWEKYHACHLTNRDHGERCLPKFVSNS